jgi:anaerobic selenocysteine-containing dehydrogenase
MTGTPVTDFDRVVRTVCSPNCSAACGVNAFVKNDRVVKLEPAAFPEPGHERICLRGISMATQRIHHPDRLTHPLIREGERGSGNWRKVSWEEAYDYIIERQIRIAAEHGWKSNAWLSGSGNYGFKAITAAARVANDLGGTSFSFSSLSGDFAAQMAFKAMMGSFGWSNNDAEIAGARYLLCVGRNIADTAHSEMHYLFDAMENGTKFVMIDPRFTRSAAKADEWLAPRPGTDAALAMGMINVVINEGLVKEDYVIQHTNLTFLVDRASRRILRERDLIAGGGNEPVVWDKAVGMPVAASRAAQPALRASAELIDRGGRNIAFRTAFDANWEVWRIFTPDHAASICEVPAAQIRHVAMEYATSDPAWLWLGYGPQRYHHGHNIARAWATLAALCGNIGKPYAGISYLGGSQLAIYSPVPMQWLSPGGRKGHTLPGTQLVEIISSGKPYPLKSLWIASHAFATQSWMFKRFLSEALPELDLFVVTEQLMTPTAAYADVVLPCVSYYEDDWDLVGALEHWFLQLRRRAVTPVGESRNDFDIYKGLCERLGRGEAWQMHAKECCREILASHPNPLFNKIDWETLERDGVVRLDIERPYTPFRNMVFATPSGRMELYQEQFVDLGEEVLIYQEQAESGRSELAKTYPFTLITYKHVHSTHSQHLMLPYIREQLPEPRVEIAPADATSRDVKEGDWVRVFNERGSFVLKASVSSAVRPGTLAVPQGWSQKDFVAGHPSDLGHVPRNEVQQRIAETNYPIWDVLCDVRKWQPAP